jgi:hypothetical protein
VITFDILYSKLNQKGPRKAEFQNLNRALKKSVSTLHKDNFIRNIKKKPSRLVEK